MMLWALSIGPLRGSACYVITLPAVFVRLVSRRFTLDRKARDTSCRELRTGSIYWFYILVLLVLYTGSIYWFYILVLLVLYTGSIYWFYILVLLVLYTGSMYWF